MAARAQSGDTFGHHVILAPLGAGGMGEVYRARDQRLERDVALKILPAATVADPDSRRRLLREARTASQLNHPNICTIHEVGESGGVSPTGVARWYAAAGEPELALDWLERGFEDHETQMVKLRAWPEWDPLRSQPRFKALLARLNLPN